MGELHSTHTVEDVFQQEDVVMVIEDWSIRIKRGTFTWKKLILFLVFVSLIFFVVWAIYRSFPPYHGEYVPNIPHG